MITTTSLPSDQASPFHQMFARLRQQAGLSFQQLADRTPISVAYIHAIEKGSRRPSRDYLICLASAMALDPEQTNELIVAGGHFQLAPFERQDEQLVRSTQL